MRWTDGPCRLPVGINCINVTVGKAKMMRSQLMKAISEVIPCHGSHQFQFIPLVVCRYRKFGGGVGGGVAKHVADSRFVGKSGNAVPSQKTAVICLG